MNSTSAAPERLLLYGTFGSGKTHAWASIAQMYRDTETPGHFWVISTEIGAVARLSDGYPDFATNVTYEDVRNWDELSALTAKYVESASPGDWFIIEGVDKPWRWVREKWVEMRAPKTPATDLFDMPEVEYDWDKVKGVYYGWLNSMVFTPCHMLACGPQDEVRVSGGWQSSKDVVNMYSLFGMYPAGEKTLGHVFHSVLWCKHPRKGEWTITTVDDHTRDMLVDAPVSLFPLTYLHEVARWEL